MSVNDLYTTVGLFVKNDSQLLDANYGMLASSALLWFDFVLTFPTEVQHIWKRKISGAMLVYIVIRYTAMIDRVLAISVGVLRNSSFLTCDAIQRTNDMILTLNHLAFSAFTILGVYGVSGLNWKPLLVVVPLTLIKPALYIYLNTHYFPLPGGEMVAGSCGYHYTISPVTVTIILLLSRLAVFMFIMLPPLALRSDPILVIWPYFDDVLGPIFLSRFLLDACSLSFTDHRSHMGIPGADSIVSLSPAEVSSIRFNVSRIVGTLSPTRTDAPPDVQSRSAPSYDLDSEEVVHDEPTTIMNLKDTCSR